MSPPADDILFGRLALHYKIITQSQLDEVSSLLALAGGRRQLSEILTEKGYLTPRQVEQVLLVQRDYLAKREAQARQRAEMTPPPPPATPGVSPGAPLASPAPPGASPTAPVAPPPPPVPAPAPASSAGSPATAPASPAAHQPAWRTAERKLDALLAGVAALGASDIHLHSAVPLTCRINGRLEVLEPEPLEPGLVSALLDEVLTAEQREVLAARGQLDFAYTLPGRGRFRANAFRQQRGVDAVFRTILPEPPTLAQLGLPESLARLTDYHQGILLLTGPAGCGKSATLAALLHILNQSRHEHIITIEDPIEYIHASRSCVVNQRQVGQHTGSFGRALRAALREDPDIIAIGELRDLETISLAITAAETGHLVLATLHTNNAIRTIHRILGVFPPNLQDQVRAMLAESLRAVVSQRLLARADGAGRVPALEILIATRAVTNLIRENKAYQIRSVLQTGAVHGMVQLDVSLAELVRKGVVRREEALYQAEDVTKIPA